MLKCKYCQKECKNNNSLRNHERLCKENPNKKLEKYWLQGYDKYLENKKKDQEENKDWHDKQKLGKLHK